MAIGNVDRSFAIAGVIWTIASGPRSAPVPASSLESTRLKIPGNRLFLSDSGVDPVGQIDRGVDSFVIAIQRFAFKP